MKPTYPMLKDMLMNMHDTNPSEAFSGSIDDMPPEIQAKVRESMIARGLDPDERPMAEHNANAERLKIKEIKPARQNDFLQKHNALYCGSLKLRLKHSMEAAGIELANHHLSIFTAAHLYNALRQLSMTEISWPEMDRIIDLQVKALFANNIPKKPADLYHRISYRTGGTARSRHFDKKQQFLFRTGAASASLKQLLDSKDTVENALVQLESQVSDHANPIASVQRQKRRDTRGRKRQVSPVQLLSHFEEYLSVVLRDMEIDYISTTKACNILLEQTRAAMLNEFGIQYPSIKQPGDSNDHGYVFTVLGMLDDNQRAFTLHEKRRDKSPFLGGEQLQTAKRIFEAFFNAHIATAVMSTQQTNSGNNGRIELMSEDVD